jgi:hypothetical protein
MFLKKYLVDRYTSAAQGPVTREKFTESLIGDYFRDSSAKLPGSPRKIERPLRIKLLLFV